MSIDKWFNADVLSSVRMRIKIIVVLMFAVIVYLQYEWAIHILQSIFN